MKQFTIGIIVLTITSCGSKSNVNRIFGSDESGLEATMTEAKVAYDQGQFDHAEDLVSPLVQESPDNEEAAVLYGYIMLSKGGIDPFQLARQMIKVSQQSSSTTAANLAPTTSSSSTSASGQLSQLAASLLSLSEADYGYLTSGYFDKDDNAGNDLRIFVEGASSDLRVRVPNLVDDTLRQNVSTLRYMNQAIKTVCRFVDEDIRTDKDGRNDSEDCKGVVGERKNEAKAHFLWAFSHLAEAMVYQSVLLYTNPGESKPSIEASSSYVDSANIRGVDGFAKFASDVLEIKNAVGKVFVTSDKSMLQEALMDLSAVSKAFGKIAGMPTSMTNVINSSYESIQKAGKELGGSGNEVTSNSQAFKSQMTETLSKTVSTKIDKAVSGLTAEQKASAEGQASLQSMCASYAQLVTDQTKKNTPQACST